MYCNTELPRTDMSCGELYCNTELRRTEMS
jgi:hypothetical protein